MIQNSLSPVVTSRISSLSGRMMSVEKRSFAFTGTMSFWLYFTTRAVSVAARMEAGPGTNRPTNTIERMPTTVALLKTDRFFILGSLIEIGIRDRFGALH